MTVPKPSPRPVHELLAQAGWVRGLARRLTRDAQAADDLVQEAWTEALTHPPPAERPAGPWLVRVLTNLARKDSRGGARRARREREAARPLDEPAADELLGQMEEQRRLAQLVVELPEPYRRLVLRRYYRGDSAAAIARAEGLSAGTVRSQLARARSLLRQRLTDRCGGDAERARGALFAASAGPSGLVAGALAAATPWIVMKTTTAVLLLGGAATVALVAYGPWRASDTPVEAARPPAEEESEVALTPPHDPEVEPVPEEAPREALEAPPDAAALPSPEDEAATLPPEVARVTVLAVDPAGLPLAGAWLQVVTAAGLARDFEPSEPSAADGRVSLDLPKGAYFTYSFDELSNAHLALHAAGRASAFFVARVERSGTRDQGRVVLEPGGAASGQVLDAAGRPVAGALVVGAGTQVDPDPVAARLLGLDLEIARPCILSGDDGTFELAGLGLGAGRLWAHADGFEWSHTEVQIQRGGRTSGLLLTLEPLSDAARIRGRVVDPTGAPLAGATVVMAEPTSSDEERATTGADGSFEFDLASRDARYLLAQDPEGRHGDSPQVAVEAGTLDAELRLSPLRTTVILVRDGEGEPVAQAWATADVPRQRLGSAYPRSDADGRVELRAPAASFTLRVGAEGYESTELGTFEPAALPAQLEATLTRLKRVTGIVTAGGKPVPGAKVQLGSLMRDYHEVYKGFPSRFAFSRPSVLTDDKGRFEVTARASGPGDFCLLADKEGFARGERVLPKSILETGAEDVELVLTSGGSIEGQVLAPASRGREGIVVGASRADGDPRFTRTDAEGRYRFDHLTPGPWRVEDREVEPEGRTLSLVRADELPLGFNVDVEEGRTARFDIDLSWKENLRVDGRLTLDGEGADGWSAVLEASIGADRPYELRSETLGPDGRFSVEAVPGSGVLVLRGPAGATPAARIEVEVVVGRANEPVEFALETGGLRGRVEEQGTRLRLHHRLNPQAHYEATFESGAGGGFELTGLPAGPYSLQHRTMSDYGPGWYPLRDLEVAAGEVTELED